MASLCLDFFNQSVKRDVSSAEASAMHCAAAEKQAVNGGVAKNELSLIRRILYLWNRSIDVFSVMGKVFLKPSLKPNTKEK